METMTSDYSYTIQYGPGGVYVEWYRDDWKHDGYGDNPQVAHWYGSHGDCVRRGKHPPCESWWTPLN